MTVSFSLFLEDAVVVAYLGYCVVSCLTCPLNPLVAGPGCRYALMGNEAIARGVVEAGASVVTGYPGTPSSEVIETLQRLGRDLGIYAEWAVNERVAFEIAYGAAIAGARSMATMKAPGLNVAADPVVSAAYGGVDGGLVVLVADDPGPHTTQTEQDSRWFAHVAKLPMVTPSSPQEAKDFTVKGFLLSEALGLPVLLRTTTRVNHAVGEVVTGECSEPRWARGFRKQVERFVRAGMQWNLERHRWLDKQLARAEQVAEELGLNRVEGSGELCVVTEGSAYNYVVEALGELGLGARVVKLGLLHPFPKSFVSRALAGCERVAVVEELDPYLETMVKKLVAEEERLRGLTVLGKDEGLMPLEGELGPGLVKAALAKAAGLEYKPQEVEAPRAPPRPPPLCPGCPHRGTYLGILIGISRAGYRRDEVPVFGDIGCYALSVGEPLRAIWTEHSMGASISMALGLKLAGFRNPVIATIGDSTFFHAGIQPLIEAVHKRVDILVVVLDNQVVAMTGHQSTPAWPRTETGRETRPVSLEEVIRSIGVDNLVIVDPENVDEVADAVAKLLRAPGVNVIIARRPCALLDARLHGVRRRYRVVEDKCTGCNACIAATGCPALYRAESGKVAIMEADCLGCGICTRFCPYNAIVPVEEEEKQ